MIGADDGVLAVRAGHSRQLRRLRRRRLVLVRPVLAMSPEVTTGSHQLDAAIPTSKLASTDDDEANSCDGIDGYNGGLFQSGAFPDRRWLPRQPGSRDAISQL